MTHIEDVEGHLIQHLTSIGVTALHKKEIQDRMRYGIPGVTSVRWANIQVHLNRIKSIEVWRNNWVVESESRDALFGGTDIEVTQKDIINYVLAIEPGVTVTEGVQALLVTKRTFWKKIKSFEWRAFPALKSRLEADKLLNSRVMDCLIKNQLAELCIKKLSYDEVGITMNFYFDRLPSREVLDCIDDLAKHVNDLVKDKNRVEE